MILDDHEIYFPNPALVDSDSGLIAVGGDLSLERLWLAYRLGIFPWYNPGEEILWWCPDPRFVLFPKELKVSKSMRKVLNSNKFQITENKSFKEVMEGCQKIQRQGQDGTWITDELIEQFCRLHILGVAQSVEVWQNEELVGGFYGLKIGRVFCGESMFSRVSNASKAGFIHFVTQHRQDYHLIDCQIHSAHLESLGARMIPKQEFLKVLNSGTVDL